VSRFLVALWQTITGRRWLGPCLVGAIALGGSTGVGKLIGPPVPAVSDEFGHLMVARALASGTIAGNAPDRPEFFETIGILVRPTHASKYPPGQGAFLALGLLIDGDPALGVWLTSGTACAAVCWMLQVWLGTGWGLLGGLLFALRYGIVSYWSQSYWGGMVSGLGAALLFGGLRALVEAPRPAASVVSSAGLAILWFTTPLQSAFAAAPFVLVLAAAVRQSSIDWRSGRIVWMALPFIVCIVATGGATACYNRSVTGSALSLPYVEHERQYQVYPPILFMPANAGVEYRNAPTRNYYTVFERRVYEGQLSLRGWVRGAAVKLRENWSFYFGWIAFAPVLAQLCLTGQHNARRRLTASTALVLVAVGATWPENGLLQTLSVFAAPTLIWISRRYVEDPWLSAALRSVASVAVLVAFLKWGLVHYAAPVAPLLVALQVSAIRAVVHERASWSTLNRGGNAAFDVVKAWCARLLCMGALIAPAICTVELVATATVRSARTTRAEVPLRVDVLAPPRQGWSLERFAIDRRLRAIPGRHLVFVQYAARHNVNQEWVFNDVDLAASAVLWVHDLGTMRNAALIADMPDRQVWYLTADRIPAVINRAAE
jgi:hypothetical protein